MRLSISNKLIVVEGQFDDAEESCVTEPQDVEKEAPVFSQSLRKSEEEDLCDISGEIHEDDCDGGVDDDDDSDDEDDDDYVDWTGECGDFTKKYNAVSLNKTQTSINPNQQNKQGGHFQPTEKVMKKYIDKISVQKYTGPSVSSSVSTSLKGKKLDDNRFRDKDKSNRATAEQVMDPRTRMILFKMLRRGVMDEINGCISTGKEANVYYATTKSGEDRAIKVYKTSILVFKDRDKYVSGEFRFRHGYCKHNPRKMVKTWAEKEMRNLIRIYQAGILCPEPILLRSHVLVMGFLGTDGWPAPLLKDCDIGESKARELYLQSLHILRTLYHQCKLIHADFSEYNLLYHRGNLYVIDVSQSVEHDHPQALEFLRNDCLHVTDFFRKKGVSTLSVKELFDFVTDITITADNLDEYLDRCMQITANRTVEDISEQDKIDEEVFKNTYIPRTLDQVIDYERDYNDMKQGDMDEFLYSKIIGLKTDLSGPEHVPLLLQDPVQQSSKENDEAKSCECTGAESNIDLDQLSESNEESSSDCEMGDVDDDGGDNNNDIDLEVTSNKKQTVIRLRDESPNSKKERKRLVKEAQKEKRQKKLPKHLKKRKEKLSKQEKKK